MCPNHHTTPGNARWSPPVSQYVEAAATDGSSSGSGGGGGGRLQGAARPLLTVAPPESASGLTAGTAELMTAGRLPGSIGGGTGTASSSQSQQQHLQALTLERPSTAERGQGRDAPLVVLRPRADNGWDPDADSTGGAADGAAAATAGKTSTFSTAPSARATRVTGDPASSVGGAPAAPAQSISASRLAADAGGVELKVALSPQRPRTLISFGGSPAERAFTTDSAGARPVLTLFEHVGGARVGEGLFTAYALPNGRTAYMYCAGESEGERAAMDDDSEESGREARLNPRADGPASTPPAFLSSPPSPPTKGGALMDEAEIAAVRPPPRPTTVPLALQQSMPLAEVLELIARPPGSAPPYVAAKPVPRLAPLPARHTLAVRRPERLDAAAFGALREDNLRLIVTANVRPGAA